MGIQYMGLIRKAVTVRKRCRGSFPRYVVLENEPSANLHNFAAANRGTNPGLKLYQRNESVQSATAKWLAQLTQADPWWKSILPGVSS